MTRIIKMRITLTVTMMMSRTYIEIVERICLRFLQHRYMRVNPFALMSMMKTTGSFLGEKMMISTMTTPPKTMMMRTQKTTTTMMKSTMTMNCKATRRRKF